MAAGIAPASHNPRELGGLVRAGALECADNRKKRRWAEAQFAREDSSYAHALTLKRPSWRRGELLACLLRSCTLF